MVPPGRLQLPDRRDPLPGALRADVRGRLVAARERAVDVPIDLILAVTFSDYPDPDTVGEPSMLLTTGVFRVPETYRVDLAGKAVTMTPAGWLGTNLGYTVTVMPSSRRWPAAPAPAASAVHHRRRARHPPFPAVPALADVQAIFSARCAGGCHADAAGGCLAAPAGGLSLCAAEARDALVDVPSREVSSLALVAPLDSARSYLVRKLLPATAGGGPIPGTLGQREPPGAPLPPDEIGPSQPGSTVARSLEIGDL